MEGDKKTGNGDVVSKPRETEGKETDEGSLSTFIVPPKGGESAPRDPPVREGRSLFVELYYGNTARSCAGTHWTRASGRIV